MMMRIKKFNSESKKLPMTFVHSKFKKKNYQ